MVPIEVRPLVLLEFSVILMQVLGVAALCLTRLMPRTRWASIGRVGFVAVLLGLGVAGALCSLRDSEFALFAGGTMTILLIGMVSGSASGHATAPGPRHNPAEATLAG